MRAGLKNLTTMAGYRPAQSAKSDAVITSDKGA